MIGISIKPTIGIGDALQYSSLPENFFKASSQILVDVSRPWFFDHNPYVLRDASIVPLKTIEMWNFSPKQYEFPEPRKNQDPARASVYLSNAEIWAAAFGVPLVLNRPRLYKFEEYPYEMREDILLHTEGISHGEMPKHIVDHILNKYRHSRIYHVGASNAIKRDYGIPRIETPSLWHFAELVSKARMFIGMDSGPAWIAACYPDVVVKKIRTKPHPPELFKNWIPLEIRNIHSHWDDRSQMIYNVSENDIGFTWSYLRI